MCKCSIFHTFYDVDFRFELIKLCTAFNYDYTLLICFLLFFSFFFHIVNVALSSLFWCICVARDSMMTSAGGIGLSSITVSPIYKSSQSVSHQSICFAETEHMLSVNGKESSIVLDLEPNRIQLGPCKRTFKALEPHGFIVKLLKFRSKQMRNPNSHIDSNAGGVSIDVYNETTTCPLNIVSP